MTCLLVDGLGAPAVLIGSHLLISRDLDFVHQYAAARALLPDLHGAHLISLLDGAELAAA